MRVNEFNFRINYNWNIPVFRLNIQSINYRRLFLNDNQISDIGRGTFGAITRIGTINLARNAIPKVDYQMFAQLNYIEVSIQKATLNNSILFYIYPSNSNI